jgi:low affinity Fe/Cu permease
MDWQPYINLGIGLVCSVMGWVLRTMYGDIRELADSVANHRVEVARDYATNSDIRDINAKLDELLRYVRK